ncbi:MAG: hypothetical protein H7067_15150 [Burkholderiales bacterium]|nr:hypothetical protein [Opitutaceae bacterium]
MKALTLALCILALLGSAASGYFWWEVGNTKETLKIDLAAEQMKATALQSNLTKTTEDLESTKGRLQTTDAELGDTKSKLTAAEARNVQISREVVTLKTAVAAKEKSEKTLNEELDTIRRDLVQARLAAQVGSPDEVERYKQTIASLESRLAEVQSGGSGAGTVAGASASATPGAPALSERTAAARVAIVGTKNAFVILDLGVADGISVGNKFLITRTGETIAESTISEVKDTFAIAQIAPASIKTSLKAGDIATYTK